MTARVRRVCSCDSLRNCGICSVSKTRVRPRGDFRVAPPAGVHPTRRLFKGVRGDSRPRRVTCIHTRREGHVDSKKSPSFLGVRRSLVDVLRAADRCVVAHHLPGSFDWIACAATRFNLYTRKRRSTLFRFITIASLEGTNHMNEDSVGTIPATAWVVDGATPLEPPFELEGVTSASWYAQRISQELAATFAEDDSHEGEQFVRQSIAHVQSAIADELLWTLDEGQYHPPSASMALANCVGEFVEVCTVGDVEAIVLFQGGGTTRVAHDLQEKVVETPSGETEWGGIPDLRAQRRAITDDGEGSAHVLSVRPLRPDALKYERFPASDVASVLLYSDGVTALLGQGLDLLLDSSHDIFVALGKAREDVPADERVDDASLILAAPSTRRA